MNVREIITATALMVPILSASSEAQVVEEMGNFSLVCEMPGQTISGIAQYTPPLHFNFIATDQGELSHSVAIESPFNGECLVYDKTKKYSKTGWKRNRIQLWCESDSDKDRDKLFFVDRLSGTVTWWNSVAGVRESSAKCEVMNLRDFAEPKRAF